MAITAKQVKELRERTGAGVMDAKKALVEVDGDIDKAIEYLHDKGMAKAAKKADRVAAEGLTGVCVAGKVAALTEINSENEAIIYQQLEDAWNNLDQELDPNFHYIAK